MGKTGGAIEQKKAFVGEGPVVLCSDGPGTKKCLTPGRTDAPFTGTIGR